MSLQIVRNDITHMAVDAIVNTANPRPVIGAGTDSAVHKAAGAKLLEARKRIGQIDRGDAVMTPGFDLSAKYVIHAVGCRWRGGFSGEKLILRHAYESALNAAWNARCRSIAFPLMGAGSYHFPKGMAMDIALSAFENFAHKDEMDIYLVLFGMHDLHLSDEMLQSIASFIDENYVQMQYAVEYGYHKTERRLSREEYQREFEETAFHPYSDSTREETINDSRAEQRENASPLHSVFKLQKSAELGRGQGIPMDSLKNRVKHLDDNFSQALMMYMIEKNLSDVDVYRKINMDKTTFNKIKNHPEHTPSRVNALAIAIGLELNIDQTKDFIARAGYALSSSSAFDLIISAFITYGNYHFDEINETLYELNLPTLSKSYGGRVKS